MNLRRLLGHFRRDKSGSAALELMLVIPLFVFVMSLTVTGYGFFKAQARNTKASWAMADAVSRETRSINPAFLDTLEKIHQFVSQEESLGFRLTVVDYVPYTKSYRIRWTQARARDGVTLPSVSIANLQPKLPKLVDFETIIVMQTYLRHAPFSTAGGFATREFVSTSVTRPRNGPQTCWTTSSDPQSTTRTC